MPRSWNETIETHRRQVRETILDTAGGLAAEHGLFKVTMSQVAEHAGIGRATLYKYFASVEEILRAWHDRQISGHLESLTEIAEGDLPPFERLTSVLEAYARIQRHRANHHTRPHGRELAAFLHRDQQLAPAQRQLHDLVAALLADAAGHGHVRTDVSPDELASYCLAALAAAGNLRSKAASERLVTVILDGLRHPR